METTYEPEVTTGIFAALGGLMLFFFIFAIFMIICYWKIFEKAGKPGWAAIIPIYNMIVLLEIVGKPTWWIILLFIPFVNFVILIIVTHQLSLSFGKDVGFTILLLLLGFIALPILAFGSAQYVRPVDAVTPI